MTNDEKNKLKKALKHSEYMRNYYATHPEAAEKNRIRARERQRRLQHEKKQS